MKIYLRFVVFLPVLLVLALLFANRTQSQTELLAPTTIFTEDWEAAAVGMTAPDNWGVDVVSGSNILCFVAAGYNPMCSPNSGSRMVEFQSYTYASADNRLKMTTPVNTVGINSITMDFRWLTDTGYSGSPDKVLIQWSTNGTSWTTAATFLRYAVTQEWTMQTVPLPAGAANQPTLYIAFDFVSAYGNNCHLDSVHIKGTPVPLALPFAEDWEAAAIGQYPPNYWAVDVLSGSNIIWFMSEDYQPYCFPYSGSRMAEFRCFPYPYSHSNSENRLKMQVPVSTVGCDNIKVDFRWLTDPGWPVDVSRVNVQWSTNGTSWTTAATFLRYASTQAWTLQTVPLPAGAANQLTLYIGFEFINHAGNDCHLDSVHITSTVKNDFNGDGIPDILWRHAAYGDNAVWFMGPGGENVAAGRSDIGFMDGKSDLAKSTRAPIMMENRNPFELNPRNRTSNLERVTEFASGKRDYGIPAIEFGPAERNYVTMPLLAGTVNTASLGRIGYSYLQACPDTNWKIGGTGDFDGDGKADILWHNDVTLDNAVWFMNGVTLTGYTYLNTCPDLYWKIVGTGDFDGDGKVDILWHNDGTLENAVWFMNGATLTGYAYLNTCPDLSWTIVGTGDFDGDGKVDILWHNDATRDNAAWFMNGVTFNGYTYLNSLTDANWKIGGVGDFDGDGHVDILWRHETTGYNAVWYMNGTTFLGYQYLLPIGDLNWKIVNR